MPIGPDVCPRAIVTDKGYVSKTNQVAAIVLLDLRKVLLDIPGRTTFDLTHDVAQRALR